MPALDNDLLEDGTLEENFEAVLARVRGEPDDGKEHREANAAQLMCFIAAMETGQPIPPSTLENLKHVFVDVLEGVPFDTAFPLPGRDRRRKSERTQQKHSDMWRVFEYLVNSRDYSKEHAYKEVGDLFGVEPDSVKKALTRERKKQGTNLANCP